MLIIIHRVKFAIFPIDYVAPLEPVLLPRSLAFQCDSCQQGYCIDCRANEGRVGPWHTGTCEDRIRELEGQEEERRKFAEWQRENSRAEEAFRELKEREGYKSCPSCQAVIERTLGCDHMTCSSCRCNFCYVCGKWSSSNPRARGDCGQHCQRRK